MIFDYENKLIQVKIVYYGPAMSGKTTSIKSLFSYFKKEDILESIENSVGRTLFFDFGVLKFQGKNWGIKFLIYSTTGQDFYASTRPATLNGVDGIIFIVDSRMDYLSYNLRSWGELKSLFREEVYNIPIIVCLNKYDLNGIKRLTEKEFLSLINHKYFRHISIQKCIAIKGKGVLESFSCLIKFILPDLQIKVNITN